MHLYLNCSHTLCQQSLSLWIPLLHILRKCQIIASFLQACSAHALFICAGYIQIGQGANDGERGMGDEIVHVCGLGIEDSTFPGI